METAIFYMANIALPKNRGSVRQMACYALVGIVSNCAGYLVYLGVTHLGVSPKMTMTFLYSIGATISFLGNRRLTFSHKGSLLGSGVRYFLAQLVGYFINLAILLVFVDKFGFPHQVIQGIAILIVAVFLFLTFKFFVFTETKVIDSTIKIS
jgi:putative flippase GtrA